MRRLRNSLLALSFVACLGWAQTAEELESPAVNRVAEKLLCPCGCKMSMTCRMEPYPCRTCWESKKKILAMQAAGLSDQAILDRFSQEMGKEVVAVPPGILGSMSFYAAGMLGLILVWFIIRRYSRKNAVAAGPTDDAELNKYHDQIEKEVERLD